MNSLKLKKSYWTTFAIYRLNQSKSIQKTIENYYDLKIILILRVELKSEFSDFNSMFWVLCQMAKIVGVHGINQEYEGRHTIHTAWLPALKDGLERAGASLDSDQDLLCAFYGDLFRGQKSGTGIPNYDASDIQTDWEQELLLEWWSEFERIESGSGDSVQKSPQKGRISQRLQQALNALSGSKQFGGIAEKFVIFVLKQVGAYLEKPQVREHILQRVSECISDDTRVLVGHSLGSVACYESLCQHPEWPIQVLVTLGSPLGIQRLIFDRLQPPPQNSLGQWPGSVKKWINIADVDDVVALRKQLNPLFDGEVIDKLVDNGGNAHDATRYFTSEETGSAIKLGLVD